MLWSWSCTFFFVKHCCLFQSKEARHAPLVWPGVEQLMILRHSRLKPCYATTTYTDLKNPGAIGVGRWTQTAEELAMQSRLEIDKRNLKNNILTIGRKSMLLYFFVGCLDFDTQLWLFWREILFSLLGWFMALWHPIELLLSFLRTKAQKL